MKTLMKISILAVIVFGCITVTASAKGPASERRGRVAMDDDEMISGMLEQLDPEEAQRLEQLKEDDPEQFKREFRAVISKQRRRRMGSPSNDSDGFAGQESRKGRGMLGMTKGQNSRATSRVRGHMDYKAQELSEWLEKNEPEKAAELATLKAKDRGKYMRKMSIEMKKYRGIIEAEKSNPELATILKEDFGLKTERDDLLKKISVATDDDEKDDLSEELENVISKRFDVILKKKQLRYDELAKRLEELKKQVKQNKSELDNFADKKSEYISERVKSQIEGASEFKWE